MSEEILKRYGIVYDLGRLEIQLVAKPERLLHGRVRACAHEDFRLLHATLEDASDDLKIYRRIIYRKGEVCLGLKIYRVPQLFFRHGGHDYPLRRGPRRIDYEDYRGVPVVHGLRDIL